MFVARDMRYRIVLRDRGAKVRQRLVLGHFEGAAFQAFQFDALRRAYGLWSGGPPTDETTVLRAAGMRVATVEGDPALEKLTTLADFERAEQWLAGRLSPRTGIGFDVHAFASAEEFLGSRSIDDTRCLLLDIAMPGMSGPALQRELMRRRRRIPIVFITANADDSLRPQLLAAGAVDCLLKPFSESALLEAVTTALRAA